MQANSKRTRSSAECSITSLPGGVLRHIFGFLSQRDALQSRLVCKRWTVEAGGFALRIEDVFKFTSQVRAVFPNATTFARIESPCVASLETLLSHLGPNASRMTRLFIYPGKGEDMPTIFRLLQQFENLAGLWMDLSQVSGNGPGHPWKDSSDHVFNLLARNAHSLEHVELCGYTRDPFRDAGLPPMPYLQSARLQVDSAILRGLDHSLDLKVFKPEQSWRMQCDEKSRRMFLLSHRNLLLLDADFSELESADSTQQLELLHKCRIVTHIPVAANFSAVVSFDTCLSESAYPSRIYGAEYACALLYAAGVTVGDIVESVSHFPRLDTLSISLERTGVAVDVDLALLELDFSLDSRALEVFSSVRYVLFDDHDEPWRGWAVFPNIVGALIHSTAQLEPLAKHCSLLQSLTLAGDYCGITNAISLQSICHMQRLKVLHLSFSVPHWPRIRAILDMLARELPLLRVCVCPLWELPRKAWFS